MSLYLPLYTDKKMCAECPFVATRQLQTTESHTWERSHIKERETESDKEGMEKGK